jgi:hypothetical protein
MKSRNEMNIQVLLGMIVAGIFTIAFIYGIVSTHITSTARFMFPTVSGFILVLMMLPPWIKFFNELKAPWMGVDGYLPYAVNSRPYASGYDHVLNYCEQVNKDEYIFYKVIKIPMINKFIRRTYKLEKGTSTRIVNPAWMDSIKTSRELRCPTPTNIPAYPYLGYKIITKFSQDNIHIIEFPDDTDEELHIYFNSPKGWKRVFGYEIDQRLDQSTDAMKMEWNMYQVCC